MPSSRDRDWTRVSGDPETGANPALWDPGVIRAASGWALAMGALGILGVVVIVTMLQGYPIAEDPLLMVSLSVSVIVAILSLYYGFQLRTPTYRSEQHLTILVWLYSLLLALAVAESIASMIREDGYGPGLIRFIILGLALRAFIRGRGEMTDFPGSRGVQI